MSSRRYLLLSLLFVWALSVQLTNSINAVYQHVHRQEMAELPFYRSDTEVTIKGVARGYEASGLKPGDRIVEINGAQSLSERSFAELQARAVPGSTLHLTVVRAGQRITRDIRLRSLNSPRFGWAAVIGLSVTFPLICLLVGFYIAFARPNDPLAWITLAMLITFGHIVFEDPVRTLPLPLQVPVLLYHELTQTWPLWLVLFALYFPVPFPWIRGRMWLLTVIALPIGVLSVADAYQDLVGYRDLAAVEGITRFLNSHSGALVAMVGSYIALFFVLLWRKRSMLPTADAKRRFSVMLVGCYLSITPLIPVVMSENGVLPPMRVWLLTIALLMVLIFPLTMAYVIVVQQAMDVRMVVRLGVKYTIASNGLKVLRLLLTVGLATLTFVLARDNTHPLETAALAAASVGLIVGLRRLLEQVSIWMDRRFFREAYDAEIILAELSSSVAGIRDIGQLVETVGRRIAASLHVQKVAMLLDRDGFFRPVYAMGYPDPPTVSFPRSASTVRLVRQMGSAPSRIFFDDPQSWVHGTPPSEQEALQQLGAELLLPVSLKSRLLGLICLGPKRSEAPYSRTDLQLLGAVASQAGLALENAELTENVRREVAQRERLDRELEIAREVQQRLFPQNLPSVQGLDFAGYCRPASGVGGDYYDFVRLPTGEIGIAIGDVSGKGIAAALMMASLQASLRGQIIKPCETLSEMIGLVNRLVFDASAANRYATFFYAQYNPQTRSLRYVNAGHNAPMVLRRGGAEAQCLRLEASGTVVGLFADAGYSEARVVLEPGDTFLAFTDGVSEAQDTAENEFGEEKLIVTAQAAVWRSSAELISAVVDQVDRFTAGAPQHDDMTLVVMRLQ